MQSSSEGRERNGPNRPCHVDSSEGGVDEGWETLIESSVITKKEKEERYACFQHKMANFTFMEVVSCSAIKVCNNAEKNSCYLNQQNRSTQNYSSVLEFTY